MLDAASLTTAISRRKMVDILLGDNMKADAVLKGGHVVNVVTCEVYEADVALHGESIIMVGDCGALVGEDTKIVDITGQFVSPGLVDSHMHIESAMLTATEFTRLSLPTGTTTIVHDPHEVANVLGVEAVAAIAEECATLPTNIHTRPPCRTPDMPGLETAGYDIDSTDMDELLSLPTVTGIGEIQGVSLAHGVYRYTPEVFDDVIASTTFARANGYVVDGNAPGIKKEELAAHIIAGGTDVSCHETTTHAECLEKLRNGVYVLMREGSTQKNMGDCIQAHLQDGVDTRRMILATDDMLPQDLLETGHMNEIVRRTIAAGVEPARALQMASINATTWFGMDKAGAILPGKQADIVVFKDLESLYPSYVFLKGKLVAKDRELLIDLPVYTYPESVKTSVKRGPVSVEELQIRSDARKVMVNAVGLIVDQNLSGWEQGELEVKDGAVQADLEQDLVHICVIERHGRTNGVGKGFVHGFNMKHGAIAETVSHDTHNLIVMGTNHEDMVVAANRVIEMQGGISLAKDGEVLDDVPLRICGLMSDELTGQEFVESMDRISERVKTETGITCHAPYMHLAFLSLATSPKLKITDKGLVNVDTCNIEPAIVSIVEK